MKPQWKVTLILLAPILLIFGGIYLKLTFNAKYAQAEYEAYYLQVARPAIEALNNDRTNGPGSDTPNALADKSRANAMSAMLTHAVNQKKHQKELRRNQIVGYILLGMCILGIIVFAYGHLETRNSNGR